MNTDEKLDQLFRQARAADTGAGRLEYGFETRLMSRLRDEPTGGFFTWSWRLAPFFAVLAIGATCWARSESVRNETAAGLVAEVLQSAASLSVLSQFAEVQP